jgi:hypothetical protein
MLLAIKLYSITGEATCSSSPVLITDFDAIAATIGISKNNTYYEIIQTNNLYNYLGTNINNDILNIGEYDILINSFTVDDNESVIVLNIDITLAGNPSVKIMHEDFKLHLNIETFGRNPELLRYNNIITLYNYDIGNSSTYGVISNYSFDIVLLDSINQVLGNLTNPYAKFTYLPKPFTKEINCYSMVSSGNAKCEYLDSNDNLIASSKNCTLCITEVKEIIFKVSTITSNTVSCTESIDIIPPVYFPQLITDLNCENNCNNECININDNANLTYTLNYANLTIFNVNANQSWLIQFYRSALYIDIYNYSGSIINNTFLNLSLSFEDYVSNPNGTYTFIPSEFGDNIIKVKHCFELDLGENSIFNLQCCTKNLPFETCNFWTIENTKDCNIFKLNNCGSSTVSITLQTLQNNTLINLSTSNLEAFSSTNLTFEEDGIYVINVTKDSITKSYTLPIFCNFQECWLKYLNKYLCKENCDDCKEKCDVEFQSFMINAHTYLLLLNEEMNFNYIYDSITEDKIKELSDIQMFINRLKEYCNPSTSPCIPCNK